MLGEFDKAVIGDLAQRFAEAIEKLQSFGVRVGGGTRLQTYGINLDKLADGHSPSGAREGG